MWQSLSRLSLCSISRIGARCTLANASPSAFIMRSQFSQSYVALSRQPRPSQWVSSLEPGGPKCHCGEPAVERTVRGHTHNTGRQFFACKHPRDSPQNCGYFSWADGTVAFGPEAWKRWGETHGKTNWKEAMRRHWARRADEDIPEVVRKALEEVELEDE